MIICMHVSGRKMLLVLVTVTIVAMTTGQSLNHTRAVYTELFITKQYNKLVRPVLNQTECIMIYAQFGLISVTNFDIRTGRLTISASSTSTWNDPQLTWNASNYGNLTEILVPFSHIWVPEILQYSADIATNKVTSYVVWVHNTGQVSLTVSGNFETTCETNVFAFPYDTHDCVFNFVPSSYSAAQVQLIAATNLAQLFSTWVNQEWEYKAEACSTDEVMGPVMLSRLKCSISLNRRPQFLVYHLLVPLLCLISVTIFVFFVPITSGERLGFSVTLFLAYTVQLAALLEELPRNSITMPFYSQAMVGLNIISALCVIFSVTVTRLSLQSNARIPQRLKTLVVWWNRKKHHSSTVIPMASGNTNESDGPLKYKDIGAKSDIDADCFKNVRPHECEVTWLEVAQFVDWFLFIVVLLAVGTGLGTAVVVVIWPSN